MLANVDRILRGQRTSFGPDITIFRGQIGSLLLEKNPSAFTGLVPARREPVENMPHPEIFNLDEFTALGLRRNPLSTVEILDLDDSDIDDKTRTTMSITPTVRAKMTLQMYLLRLRHQKKTAKYLENA